MLAPTPMMDLSEYVVRAIRLYLQIREVRFHTIDKGKFEVLSKVAGNLNASA